MLGDEPKIQKRELNVKKITENNVIPHSPADFLRSGGDVGENLIAATAACP